MAWNDEDNQDKDKNRPQDPWSGRGKKKEEGPPDLEEAVKRFKESLNNLFSRKGNGGSKPPPSIGSKGFAVGIGLFALVILGMWFLAGFYTIQPAQKGVVLRFGKYVTTQGPGLHWIPRIIDTVTKVNIQKIYAYSYDASMLTKDENIVSVGVTVQFRIENPKNYLYNVVNAVESLKQATASALRQVVGLSTLDAILTRGREQVRQQVKVQLELILKRYKAGLAITDVALQTAKAPEEVADAFADAIKAQEDQQRFINKAQAYSKRVVPIASGNAKRILEASKAYRQQVVLNAEANTARFLALLPQYQKQPKITSERLYLGTMQKVLTDSSKVLVDVKGSNNLIYLPIDKLLNIKSNTQTEKSDTTKSDLQPILKSTGVTSLRPDRMSGLRTYERGGAY